MVPRDPASPRSRQPDTDRRCCASVANRLITTPPPAIVMLCVINVVFLGVVRWFLAAQTESRMKLLTRMVDACVVFDHDHPPRSSG